MDNPFFHQLKRWNSQMNGLPRKALLIAITLGSAAALFFMLPYIWPFLLAFIFSMALEPLVGRLQRGLGKVKLPRTAGTLLGMLLLFGVVGVAAGALITRLIQELTGLVKSTPQLIAWLSDVALPAIRALYEEYSLLLPSYLLDMVQNAFNALGQTLLKGAGTLSATLTSGAFTTAMSIPNVLLSIVLTIMGTYYLTADRPRIWGYFRRMLPDGVRGRFQFIQQNLLLALFGQAKSQLLVSLIGMGFLTLAFVIYRIPYGFVLGVLIGVADALPVLGAGLFLIPWSIISFIAGDVSTGIFMACAYVGIIVIRQVAEPRIVGKNLGLYPLATMVAIYVGYRLMGFVGLLAGPVLLNVIKVVLEADQRAHADGAHS